MVYDDPSGYKRKACPPQGKISESVDGSGSTTADIYSFGNKLAPRGARPQQDFNVEKFDSIVGLMSLMSYTNHYHGNTEEKNDKYV